MIFGTTIQFMDHGEFGQSPSDVKKLQEAFKAIQTKTGDKGFDPGAIDGTIRKETVFALVYTVNKVKGAPGISDLFGLINKIPKAGTFISMVLNLVGTDRGAMNGAWTAMEFASSGTQKSVMDFIASHAGTAAKAVALVGAFLGAGAATKPLPPGAFPTSPGTQQVVQTTSTGAGTFPPGSVAVRDPALGKFRIVTPAK
jgi:hypothetical protein